ncbi:hypothetical protein D3C86_1258140 [compost metagenome]
MRQEPVVSITVQLPVYAMQLRVVKLSFYLAPGMFKNECPFGCCIQGHIAIDANGAYPAAFTFYFNQTAPVTYKKALAVFAYFYAAR